MDLLLKNMPSKIAENSHIKGFNSDVSINNMSRSTDQH